MIRNRTRFALFLLLSVIWMFVIYSKSAQPYQQQDIKPMMQGWIAEETLLNVLPHTEFTYDGELVSFHKPYSMAEFFVRKGGHVTEYLILTALLWQTLAATTIRRGPALLLTFLLAVLYSCSDEYHQTFVAGRTGHPIDVGMDSVGMIIALLFPLVRSVFSRQDTAKKAS